MPHNRAADDLRSTGFQINDATHAKGIDESPHPHHAQVRIDLHFNKLGPEGVHRVGFLLEFGVVALAPFAPMPARWRIAS